MIELKNTPRSLVSVSFDGRVYKTFRGPHARRRFLNEVSMLLYLEKCGCEFVPCVLAADLQCLKVEMTHCGQPVQSIGAEKCHDLFNEIAFYGVVHDDPCSRNITYRLRDGRFCVIDFEYSRFVKASAEAGLLHAVNGLQDFVVEAGFSLSAVNHLSCTSPL
jgi:tRNA A-37 threonylcarbamoyl transferase component Bud32